MTRGVGEGAGLGLPAAPQIVKAHDGDIAIESHRGLTIATVRLPAQS
jgi:nitrogen-specific signal transduction histidine kinase